MFTLCGGIFTSCANAWRRVILGNLLFVLLFSASVQAAEILTNAVHTVNAPAWITSTRLNRVTDHIQSKMEWDTHRIELIWYTDEDAFENIHHLGPAVMAFTRAQDNTVHLGPNVTDQNFDAIFGHEMVHVISFQKYKGAIPRWLEEGLANYLAHNGTVDYAKLAAHPPLTDVTTLTHPFGGGASEIRARYMMSQALAEMIATKCDLPNLMRLSVGRKMEDYLNTFCRITDLTGDFNKWVQKNAKTVALPAQKAGKAVKPQAK